jgi:hypothetical protein
MDLAAWATPDESPRRELSMRHILGWICLVFVATTGAYGLQLAAAATVPTAADDQSAVTEPRGPTLQQAATTSTHMLLITGFDESTGERIQLERATSSDRVAVDALAVQLKNLGNVAGQLCSGSAASVLGPEPFY